MASAHEVEAALYAFVHMIADEIRRGNRDWARSPYLTDAVKAALDAAERVRAEGPRDAGEDMYQATRALIIDDRPE